MDRRRNVTDLFYWMHGKSAAVHSKALLCCAKQKRVKSWRRKAQQRPGGWFGLWAGRRE